MAGNSLIGALTVTLGADTAAFATGLKDAQGKLGKFGQVAASLGKTAFLGIAAGAAAGGAAMVKFGFDAIAMGDDIGDAANRIGITAEAFQKLQIAGVKAGGSTELMTTAMDKLNQNLGAAHQGSKGMSEAFKSLGLDADKLKTGDQAFYAIAKGMENIKDPAEKAKLSMQLFGKAAGVDMLEVLGAGGDALKQYGDAAATSGRVMSDEMVKKLGDAKIVLDDTKTAFTQMATVMGGQAVIGMMEFSKQMKPVFDQMKQIGSQVMDFLKPSLDELGKAFKSLASNEALISTLKVVGTVVGGVLVGAFRLAVDVITIAIKAFDGLFRKIGEAGKWLGDAANKFTEFGKNIVDGLVKGFNGAKNIAIQAVKDLGANIIAAFKAILGIHSPSREFMKFGMFINEGLGDGLYANDNIPIDAAKHMGNKLLDAFDATLKPRLAQSVEDMQSELRSAFEGLLTEQERFQQDIDKNREIFAKNLVGKGQANRSIALEGMTRLKDKQLATVSLDPSAISTSLQEVLKEAPNDFANVITENDNLRIAFASSFSDGLKSAMTGDLGDFLKNKFMAMQNDILTKIFNGIGTAVFDLFNGKQGSSGGGNIWSTLATTVFGGFRANGGAVSVGKSYIVGERGPELFTPSQSGSITSNDNLMQPSGGETVVNAHFMLDNEILQTQTFRIASGVTTSALQGISTRQNRRAVYGS